MRTFKERLGRERLYWDGGTGSVLQQKGLTGGELPERWNLTHPDEIRDLARSYFCAGSDVVNANTFGANRLHYPDRKELAAVITAGVALAREGFARSGKTEGYVALDVGPTGRLLRPMGDLGFEEAVEIFSEVIRLGADAGADLVLIETMSDALEAKAAVLAAREYCDLPVCVTCVFDAGGKLLTGGTPESLVPMLEGLRVDALGLNCSLGPDEMLPIAKRLVAASSLPVVVSPNAGLPRSERGRTVYDLTQEAFARGMREIAQCGAHVLGGCCGTTPEFIRACVAATRDVPFCAPVPKNETVITSFSRCVPFGGSLVKIGERINPTGKKRFQRALREGDVDYVLRQGLEQEEAGADVLDVNVGLPEIDEGAMLECVITRLQGVTPLPLQIDTSDARALEKALRVVNGKPLINSVNGKRESLDAVLPLAARYGGVLVGLPLDENGIPDTAEGRLRIAARIVREAEQYGIAKKDIVIDGLAMTISTDDSSAKVTLETIRRLRYELGVHTILGVSNISFGLPQREMINAAFLTLCLNAGLSCAILNPNSSAMMAACRAAEALLGRDERCVRYISAYKDAGQMVFGLHERGAAATPENKAAAACPESAASPLEQAVTGGMESRAREVAREALSAGADPMNLVNEALIPALDRVGRDFESGSVFLPQLLMSAEAARAAFDEIRAAMAGAPRASRGRVILATVKGDIHDIGKNIVRVLLENYGYDVLDLGKDVPPETIVEAARRENIRLVGLSALMTTTVVSMQETIALLRREAPLVRVVVGGAVLTQAYADQIGADCYAKAAMDTVRYADRVFGVES